MSHRCSPRLHQRLVQADLYIARVLYGGQARTPLPAQAKETLDVATTRAWRAYQAGNCERATASMAVGVRVARRYARRPPDLAFRSRFDGARGGRRR